MDLKKKVVAEFVGTFVLVFAACGVAALTGGELVATALAFGLVIVAMAYSIGRVSGCHINPAVSLACLLDKRMTSKEFLAYVIAQILGGFCGGLVIFGIADMAGKNLKGNACNALIGAGGASDVFATLLAEFVLTAIFCFVILSVTDGNDGAGKKAGLLIGLTLTLVHLVGINLTGTSVNPARSLATALCSALFEGKSAALAQVWMFFVGPLAGGAFAAYLYKYFFKKK